MKVISVIKYAFFLVGAAMLIGAAWMVHSTREFLAGAQRTEGTVVALVPSRGSSGSTLYSPVVTFRSADGRDIEVRSRVASNPPAHDEGETVSVLYRPAAPGDAQVESFFSLWGGASIVGGIGSAFFLVGLSMILVPVWSDRRARHLAATGLPVQARVQDIERNVMVEVNGRHPWRIVARWKDPVTAEYRVFRSRNLWQDPGEHLQSDYITVYLDENNPRRYHMDTGFLTGAA
jgi:hypothetical protein